MCKCTSGVTYGIPSAKGYFGPWQGTEYDWCYLENGLYASNCPGATRATISTGDADYYWTRDVDCCNNSKGEFYLIPCLIVSCSAGIHICKTDIGFWTPGLLN